MQTKTIIIIVGAVLVIGGLFILGLVSPGASTASV